MTRLCLICDSDFDTASKEKKRVGGLITHCPDCSEENTAKYAGVSGGEGKQNSLSIIKFESNSDREKYLDYWKNNSGLYKGKSCQMTKLMSTPNINFKTVAVNLGNQNHKGKQ